MLLLKGLMSTATTHFSNYGLKNCQQAKHYPVVQKEIKPGFCVNFFSSSKKLFFCYLSNNFLLSETIENHPDIFLFLFLDECQAEEIHCQTFVK